MKIFRLAKAASIVGVALFLVSAGLSAATITFNTSAPGTGFNGNPGQLVLNNSLGAGATLTYVPALSTAYGTPSNINYGNFNLVCDTCSTQAIGAGSFFSAFTFNMIVTDETDGATGMFLGSSSGGSVWSDVSQINITWAPLQLGPGTNNALTGDFDGTKFLITTPTGIVAPNSGTIVGQTTVQGYVDTVNPIPEPSTLGMLGVALLGLGFLRRKGISRMK